MFSTERDFHLSTVLTNNFQKIMNEDEKKSLVQQLDLRFGNDIFDISSVFDVENELFNKRKSISVGSSSASPNKNAPTKVHEAMDKVAIKSKHIDELRSRCEKHRNEVDIFLANHEPLQKEVMKRINAIEKLEGVLVYLHSFEKIEELSNQLKQCSDDEQSVLLYSELKSLSDQYKSGHQATYVREYVHYWHNILKDKLSRQYEELLKLLKWPFNAIQDLSILPKDSLNKFGIITKYLLSIEEPKHITELSSIAEDSCQENACLPVKVLLRPLKKRFAFHFTGSRQTARIDRPEWFLTQTLTWIKHHREFIKKYVQPVIDKLSLKNVKAEDEFIAGLIALAAERLHTVLGLYHTQGLKGKMVDEDAAFAHAVDEALGFHKELVSITGKEAHSVLSVLTRAETFVKWLAVEKKYALAKMDETLSTNQWMEPVSSVGGANKGPRGADWMIALLATIEQRYASLPRPGHRLQFLELQLELLEEWRIRLTQILSAAASSLTEDSFLKPSGPHPLIAVINAADHTRSVLLQWAHSLHYLQLHYYRRQFHHFTQSQHHDPGDDLFEDTVTHIAKEPDESMSLKDVEERAQKMALNEVTRRNSSMTPDITQKQDTSSIARLLLSDTTPIEDESDSAGVFAEAPALLARARDAGLNALHEHMLLEVRASLREYKRQKWHAMAVLEEMALSISPSLCRPLAGLCARLHTAQSMLAPSLYVRLRGNVATELDTYIFEEVVLESWWNAGGTVQFTRDVRRNLMPAFAPPNKHASTVDPLPKLQEACTILNMDYNDALQLRTALAKSPQSSDNLSKLKIRHATPQEVLQILNQRTDLSETSPPSVMELF